MKSFIRKMWKRRLVKLFVKILISAFALWFVYQRVNIGELLNIARKIPATMLLVAFVLFNLSQLVSAARLRLFLQQEKIHISFIENIKLYYQGMYYNLLLPGGIGGDGYKVYRFRTSQHVPVRYSLRALLADRMSGAVALVSLGGIFALFIPLPQQPHLKIWIALGIIILLFITTLVLIEFFEHHLKIWWKSLLHSLIVQILQTAAAASLLAGLQVSFADQSAYLMLFLAGSLAAAVPITVGGLGARELLFLFSAKYFFINSESAVALSIAFFAITAFSALPGAALRVDIARKEKFAMQA